MHRIALKPCSKWQSADNRHSHYLRTTAQRAFLQWGLSPKLGTVPEIARVRQASPPGPRRRATWSAPSRHPVPLDKVGGIFAQKYPLLLRKNTHYFVTADPVAILPAPGGSTSSARSVDTALTSSRFTCPERKRVPSAIEPCPLQVFFGILYSS